MTPSKQQSDYRKRKAAQGLVRVEVWVPEDCVDDTRKQAAADVRFHLMVQEINRPKTKDTDQ